MPKESIISSTIEKKDNTMPSAANLINLLSGIYTSPLWEELCGYVDSLKSLRILSAQSRLSMSPAKATRHSP